MEETKRSTLQTEIEKTKVTYAQIIVGGTVDKPYFQIQYHEIGKDYDNIGFGSYYLKNVFEWRDKYLEVVLDYDDTCDDWRKRNDSR